MPIYRCNHCGSVVEVREYSPGTKLPCAQCKSEVTVFDTAFYVRKLVERYTIICRELEALKAQESETETPMQEAASDNAAMFPDEIRNSAALATEAQHKPIRDWLVAKQAQPSFDYSQVDTTGFFDEAALLIGNNHELLAGLLHQVRHAYRRE